MLLLLAVGAAGLKVSARVESQGNAAVQTEVSRVESRTASPNATDGASEIWWRVCDCCSHAVAMYNRGSTMPEKCKGQTIRFTNIPQTDYLEEKYPQVLKCEKCTDVCRYAYPLAPPGEAGAKLARSMPGIADAPCRHTPETLRDFMIDQYQVEPANPPDQDRTILVLEGVLPKKWYKNTVSPVKEEALAELGAYSADLAAEGEVLRHEPASAVHELMEDMKAKGIKEKQDEEVAFTSFKTWCDNTATSRQKSIKEANELIEQLQADIAAAESDVATLTDEIAVLDAQIGEHKKEMQAATEIRESEKADYHKTHTDYSESIDAVTRAEAVLSKQSGDVSQAMMLLQTVSKKRIVPAQARRVLESFLQQGASQDPMSVSAPQANAYEFQSSGVVDMLTKLKDKFEDERSALEKEEMTAKQSYEMMMQDLTDQVERAEKQKERKSQRKAQRAEDAAAAKGELKDTTAARDEDQKYLDDLVAGCEQKSSDFESRQKLRAEELEAIDKAIEIISSSAVSGAADKHLPGLMQTSFALRASTSASAENRGRAADFLATQGQNLHSKMLVLLAEKVQSGGPFDKVKKMIKDMIVRLMEEANEESEHKGWCDSELGANKVARDSKTEDVNTLTAAADQLTADIAKLTQEIADTSAAIAELDAAVKEATENREAEKAKNTATIADAQAAQEAVKSALAVLKEFYAKAAEATALMQVGGPMDDAPGTFDSSFKGQQAESGGVMGMLEVIASDFARLESDTTAAEDAAADEYKTFSNDSAVDRATKAAEMDNMEKLKTRKDGELTTTKKDLKGAQEELDAALAYYDKLKPSCVDAGVSYEERVERREAEIQSLQEALKILSGEDI